MVDIGTGDVRNLNESRTQAIQAIFNSLSPEALNSSDNGGGNMSAEQIQKLSEKLGELVGDRAQDGFIQQRNERGELVNEEGLPIIDVSEPLAGDDSAGPSESPAQVIEDPGIIPLAFLSQAERARKRDERDHILNILEEEEMAEEARREELESEQRREELAKRKETAKLEIEKLKAARDMQKKMGKALLRNMAEAREREEKAKDTTLAQDIQHEEQRRTLKPRKSVSFADLPEGAGEPKDRSAIRAKEAQLDWGDVTPGKLRSTKHSVLTTKAQIEKHPMKMNVVERLPVVPAEPEELATDAKDSDDESAPASPVIPDSDEGHVIHFDTESNDKPPSDSEEDEDLDDEPVLEDEFDVDTARHQREIALEYYKKRGSIGSDVSTAMTSHTHEEGEDEWDQPEVPLEATLSGSRPKPSVSRFKANRIASSYNTSTPSSTSLGPSVLPASSYPTVQRAIRTGKLEGEQLVGGSASDDEADENIKEVLELLKKGEVQNVGPNGSSSSTTIAPRVTTETPDPQPAPPRLKTSKFKLARTQGRDSSPTLTESGSSTPISTAERSSPKLPVSPNVLEHQQPSSSSPARSLACGDPSQKRPTNAPSFMPPMLVESPSFSSTAAQKQAKGTKPTTVSSPLAQTQVVDSPSFRPVSATSSSFLENQNQRSPAVRETRRPERPPTVMSTTVRESIPGRGKDVSGIVNSDETERKVSRFLAERM